MENQIYLGQWVVSISKPQFPPFFPIGITQAEGPQTTGKYVNTPSKESEYVPSGFFLLPKFTQLIFLCANMSIDWCIVSENNNP